MQAQTTRTFNGNLHKVAGGLLISAALIAGAIGLNTTGALNFPGTGSNTIAVPAPVLDRHFAPNQGEGLPLSLETSPVVAPPAGVPSQSLMLNVRQGEGMLDPAGESAIAAARSAAPIARSNENMGEGWIDYISPQADAPMTDESRPLHRFHEENIREHQGEMIAPVDTGASNY